MAVFSELILLAFSLGAMNSWNRELDGDSKEFEPSDAKQIDPKAQFESRSLYDLMAHFPTDEDITCPGSDSRFRYPGECTRYVTCRNYQAHIRSCPPGMSFDQNYKYCRLAFEVDCVDQSKLASVCRLQEVYSTCGCERTCGLQDEDIDCTARCEAGCFCRMGYVRDGTGNCVKPEDCENINNLFSIIESK